MLGSPRLLMETMLRLIMKVSLRSLTETMLRLLTETMLRLRVLVEHLLKPMQKVLAALEWRVFYDEGTGLALSTY